MRARALLALLSLGVLCGGCRKSGNLLAEAGAEHEARARAAAATVLDAYVGALVSTVGQYPLREASAGEQPPMLVWRRKAAAQRLHERAEAAASEHSGSSFRRQLRQGVNVLTAFRDFWIGQPVPGEDAVRVDPDGEVPDEPWTGDGRIIVELREHLDALDGLAAVDASLPWLPAIDFERVLPFILEVHAFRAGGGADVHRYRQILQERSLFDSRRFGADYVAYRDELCSKGTRSACVVPWEQRDLVVCDIYLAFARGKLAAFRKKYPKSPLEPVLERLEKDLAEERQAVAVKPEYPVLPGTRSTWVSSPSPQAAVELGPKGAAMILHVESGALRLPLLSGSAFLALDEAGAKELARAFADGRQRLYAATPDAYAGRRIHVFAARDVPLGTLMGALTDAAWQAEAHALVMVGRDRELRTLQLRELDLNILPEASRIPVAVVGPAGPMTCRPAWTSGDHLDPVAANVFLDGEEVVLRTEPRPPQEPGEVDGAGPAPGGPPAAAPAREARGRLGPAPDLSAVLGVVRELELPVRFCLRPDLPYASLHALIDHLGFECGDERCETRTLRPNLRFAVCEPNPA